MAGVDAKTHAGYLRIFTKNQVSHVTVQRVNNLDTINYSVSQQFLEEMTNAGRKI